MEPEPQPAAAGAAPPTRLLFAAGGALEAYESNPHSLLLIGPGSGAKMNGQVYSELERAGYTVHQVHDQDTGYDVDPANPGKYRYPRDWDRLGASLMPAAGVRDLASLARDLVWPKLLELVSKGPQSDHQCGLPRPPQPPLRADGAGDVGPGLLRDA